MKSWTYFRLILLSLCLGACTRNPLGEDLAQPILNLGFLLSQSCTNTLTQDAPYTCNIIPAETVPNLAYSLVAGTSCTWAVIDATTGVITGTPNDNQVGVCQMIVGAKSPLRRAQNLIYTAQVQNIAPTLTVANAANIVEDDPVAIIRSAAAVQASEEGFGNYGFDHANTTPPRCTDNAAQLTVDATTGAISYAPALNYYGTCNIRVSFDDNNGVANSIATSQFSITVTPVNDAPAITPLATQVTVEGNAKVISLTVIDVDSAITCSATNVTVTSSNTTLVPALNIALTGTAPNCILTLTPTPLNSGTTTLTVNATDGLLSSTMNFDLIVTSFPDPPVLAAIANQLGTEDTALSFNINITDPDTTLSCGPPNLSVTSSNTGLIPVANILFSGVPPTCTVTLNPVADQNGTSNLVISLNDGTTTVTRAFTATFSPINDSPIISAIANQTTIEDVPISFNFTISDVDNTLTCAGSVTPASSNLALLPLSNIAITGTVPNCTAILTPVADASGTSNLSLTVSDGSLSNVRNFSLTVNAVNDAPVISSISNQTTLEDIPFTVNFNLSDIDSAVTCTGSVTATSSNLTLLPIANIVFGGTGTNCTATFTPVLNLSGTSSITLTGTDGSLTATRTFNVLVTPVNDAPVISTITSQTINEDNTATINFTISDVDNTLTCAGSMSATSSNATLIPVLAIVYTGTAPNCTATLTPLANQNGTSNLSIIVTDGTTPVSQSITLTVNAVNDAPVLSAITAQTMTEDGTLIVNFTLSDVDDPVTCTASVSASSSDITILPIANIVFGGTSPNCTATISPALNANGSLNVSLTATDGILSQTRTFALTVTPAPDPPIISTMANQTIAEDGNIAVNFMITDTDSILSCTSSVSATSSNSTLNPVANIVFTGTAPNCTATLTPAANQNGTSNIALTVTDGVLTDSQGFTLTVTPVNDAPVMSAISNQLISEDGVAVVNFTITDVDNTLTCVGSLSPTSSNAGLLPLANIVITGTAPNCTATLTAVADASGIANVSLTVSDGTLTDVKNFSFTVTAVNDAPILSAISNQITTEDTPLTVNFTITDVDSTLICTSANLLATSSNAGLLPSANIVFGGTAPNCTATFTPVADANGTSNISFTVSDNGSPNLQATRNFTFSASAVNDAPVMSAIANQTISEDGNVAINFTITDVDNALNCTTSVSRTSSDTTLLPVANMVLSGTAPNCTITLTPVANGNGSSNLTITTTDGTASVFVSPTLTVTAVNDAPVLSAITNKVTAQDTPIAVNFTISDVDNAVTCASSLTASSTNTTLLPVANIVFTGTAPNCTATLSPAFLQNGTSIVAITLSDGALTSVRTFTLTVSAFDYPPTISAASNQSTLEDTPSSFNFTINDVDSTLTCSGTSLSVTSSNTTLIPIANIIFSGTTPNCTATVTPVANLSGVSTLNMSVTDGNSTVAQGAFTYTVTAVNDAPTMAAISAQTTNENMPVAVSFTIADIDNTLSCATSVTASSTNTGLVPVSNIVFSGTAPNCTATLTPVATMNGTTNISLTVSDSSLTANQSFLLTVNAVNDAPIISAVTAKTTAEDTPLAVNFTISDVDNTLTCAGSVTAASTNIGLIPVANIVLTGTAPNCTATITPTLNSTGVSTIGFTVSDGALANSNSFSFTVTAVNDAPVMTSISNQITNEDTPLTVNFTISDVDNALACATSVSASSSNLTLLPVANIVFGGAAPNCTATLSSSLNASGVSSLTFTVTDGALTDAKTFNFTVTAVNDAPVMSAITNKTTAEDNALAVTFSITDVDSALSCTTSVSASSSNTTVVPVLNIVFSGTAPNCTATVTPTADANGISNLQFTVTDSSLTDSKTFSFTVTAVNDAPTMASISNQLTLEDTPLAVNFTIADVDNAVSCSSSVSATSSNVGVIPVANIAFSGTAPNCTAMLTPFLNASGVSVVNLTVTDGALSASQGFTFTVTAVNDAPVISAITNKTTSEDTPLAVTFTISDVDNALTCGASVSASSSNTTLIAVGSIVLSGTAPNCTATISPAADLSGVSTIGLTVTDGTLTSAQSFSFTVTAVNDAPILSAISNQSTAEDTALVINFTINDIDSILLCTSANLVATSSNTTLMPVANIVFGGTAPNCTATLTPVADANGASNINITLTDGGSPNLQSAQAFTLTVTPVNDAPTQSTIASQTTLEDTAIVINFTIGDIDSSLTCAGSLSASSGNTAIVPVSNIVFNGTSPNCTATITPVANQNGVLNITFRVTDTALNTDQTFQLTVTAVDDAPTISSIGNQTINEDASVAVNFTIADIDSTLSCTTSMSQTSSNVVLLPTANIVFSGTAPNCTATLTPVANGNGVSNINLTVADGTTSVSQGFTLTVTAVNDAPVMAAILAQSTNEDTAKAVSFSISDVDSTLSCTTGVSATSSNTTLIPVTNIVFSGAAPNCTATITPVANASGSSTIGLTITDGSLTDTKSFTLTVNAIDDPPIASTIGDQIVFEDTVLNVNFTITDIDSTLVCASSLSGSSANTTVLPNSRITFSGTAPNCTMSIAPALNQNGIFNVTVTVTDGTTPVSQTFELNVVAVNDPPTIAAIGAQSTLEDTPKVVNFTIADVDSVLDCTTSMNVISSNLALMPAANVSYSGTPPSCTATFTPVANKFGSSNITLFVNDGVNTASRAFTLTVTSVNDTPVMGTIANQSTIQNTPVTFNFTITDVEAGLNCGTSVSATSSDAILLPVGNITYGGTVPNCNATLTPASLTIGTSNVAFTVTDVGGLTDTKSFVFTVTTVNNAPTISSVSNQTIYEARPNTFSFTLNDSNGPLTCTSSSLSATSTNTVLVPVANVVFSGTYPNCDATVRLANGQSGSANVTITVTDGSLTASSTFTTTGHKIVSVALSPLNPIVPKNSDFSFSLAATYSDGQVKNVTTASTWTTSNTSVSSYPTAGVLRNTYAGATVTTSTVTGAYGALSVSTNATINPATITALIVNISSATINVGGKIQIACKGLTSDGGTIDLTESCGWTSANALVASVNNSIDKGLVTGESLGSATNITASYSSFTANAAITVDIIAPTQSDDGLGLTANYYNGGTNFNNFVSSRTDAMVNFNWGAGNNPAGSSDSFSVRWTGFVKAPTSGTYTFYTQSDEGVRLYVDGVLLVNNWTGHASVEDSGTIILTAGTKYAITLEYFEGSGAAQIELRYLGPSVSKQIIPQINLYP